MILPAPLYREVLRSLPIACVDLLVRAPDGRALLVERANAPARGLWWSPGGRVHHRERRVDAAARKLREESGLAATALTELRTDELFLPDEDEQGLVHHGITTIFLADVGSTEVRLDPQSRAFAWDTPEGWLASGRAQHPFIRGLLTLAARP